MTSEDFTEFSRFVRLEDADNNDLVVSLIARPEECQALAKRFAIGGIEALQARLLLRRTDAGVYCLSGNIEAEVKVVIGGEECLIDFSVAEPVEEIFVTSSGWASLTKASPDEDVDAELVVEREIDIGEVTSQCLSLALDPLLLEAGALDEGTIAYSGGPNEDAETASPFAALATLRSVQNDRPEDY